MSGRHSAGRVGGARRRAPTPPSGLRARRGVVAMATLLVLLAVGGWSVAASVGNESCAAEDTLTLAVAPEMAGPVRETVADVDLAERGAGDVCAVTVAPTDPDDVLAALGAGAQAPDLWVPDSSAWLSQLPPAMADRPARSLGKTPLVLAGPETAPRPASWLQALSAPDAALLDPRESGAGLATLAALQAEAGHGATTGTALSTWLADAARSMPDTGVSDADLLTGTVGEPAPRWFPTTEQRLLSTGGGHAAARGLAAWVPASGTVFLDYPVVSVASGEHARAAEAVAGGLAARLASPEGTRRLADAGFRATSGLPTGHADGIGRVEETGVVRPHTVGELLTTWTSLNADARILAVLDVSGSMYDAVGSTTRAALARDALLAAVRTMPDTWDVGVWAFSQGIGAGGSDHRVLAPLQTLAAMSGDRTHRRVVHDAAARLPSLVGGGTGLYDSTLAAYREVASGYLSDRFNGVVLLTDGRNEDSQGLTQSRLLDLLRRESERARPVPVMTVGMGPEADTAALHRIARATGGASHVAHDPRDIEAILSDAFIERTRRG